jgi:hypothetical protein
MREIKSKRKSGLSALLLSNPGQEMQRNVHNLRLSIAQNVV